MVKIKEILGNSYLAGANLCTGQKITFRLCEPHSGEAIQCLCGTLPRSLDCFVAALLAKTEFFKVWVRNDGCAMIDMHQSLKSFKTP